MFPTFDKQNDIPKGFEAAYEERDGKWQAKVPDVAKLETTLQTLRSEKKDLEKRATTAEEQLGSTRRELDAAKLAGGDVEKKTSEMLAKWNQDKDAAVKAVTDEKEKIAAELRTIRLDDQVKTAFTKSGGRPEKAEAALKLAKERFDLVDGRPVVKDEKGQVSTTTVEDFWAKTFKKDMPEFFAGTKAAGGGAGGGAGGEQRAAGAGDDRLKNPLQLLKDANEAAVA